METKIGIKEFYPNACFICHARRNLKICKGCQMISYCSFSHQKEHWPEHKPICRAIAAMMKELGVSHLFEKFQGSDLQTWQSGRLSMLHKIQKRCKQKFADYEDSLFKYPRSCYVCHESRQSLLKSCPNCPSASFCEKHPSSPIHNEDCAIIREMFETRIELNKRESQLIGSLIVTGMWFVKKYLPSKQPITMHGFLTNLTDSFEKAEDMKLPKGIKELLSNYFSTPLTAHLALQKLKFSRFTELTMYVLVNQDFPYMWEMFFHLWPHLKTLNVTFFCTEEQEEQKLLLCLECNRLGKIFRPTFTQLNYQALMKHCPEPDIIIDSNFILTKKADCEDEDIKTVLQGFSRYDCPIVITTPSQRNCEMVSKMVTKIFGSTRIIFNDSNPCKSLLYDLNHEDQRLLSPNLFLTILAPKTRRVSSKIPNLFYSSVCHVCDAVSSEPVTCKRCRMISYCGKSHQDEHQAQHRELCKVILGMLTESGAPNLFDKLKTSDSNLWLRAKLELLTKARTRLGRDLVDFEMQMFLFPKTCFVCHESDSSVLRNCKCGVHLCKIHKNDEEHKILCPDLSLAFKLAITERPEITKGIIRKFKREPMSMDECLDSFIEIETKKPNNLLIPNFEKFHISDILTRPLTLLWCLEELDDISRDSLIVHVIGATNSEVAAQKYWKIILYRLRSLTKLKIIFVGPEITTKASLTGEGLKFPIWSLLGKRLKVETHALKYEDYFQSKSFVEPGIVIGFNLNLHESDFAIFNNNTWKETIMCLKKIDAPFILTAGSKIRAEKDHEKFCQLLEKNVEFLCCEENPFAGLIPERDYVTERILYCNKYMIIYDKLYEKKRSKFRGYKIMHKIRGNW